MPPPPPPVTPPAAGESRRKHTFLLEVKGNAYRVSQLPLTTVSVISHSPVFLRGLQPRPYNLNPVQVRPFVFETVALKDQAGVRPEEPESITAFLDAKVRGGRACSALLVSCLSAAVSLASPVILPCPKPSSLLPCAGRGDDCTRLTGAPP